MANIQTTVTKISPIMQSCPYRFRIQELTPDKHHERIVTLDTPDQLLEFALKLAYNAHPNHAHVLRHCRNELMHLEFQASKNQKEEGATA